MTDTRARDLSEAGVPVSRAVVADLYDAYAYYLDECDFDQWLDLFAAECHYRVTAKENFDRGLPVATMRCDSRGMLADRLYTIGHTQTYAPRTMRHLIGAPRVHGPAQGQARDETRFLATATFLLVETVADGQSRLFMAGQYHDVIAFEGDQPRFVEKVAVYDSPLIENSLIFPV